jgi:hypothetical protein
VRAAWRRRELIEVAPSLVLERCRQRMKQTLVAALAVIILVSGCSSGARALTLTDVPGGSCRSPAGGTTWADLQQTPTVFGLDYLKVTSDQPPRVTSIQLIGGRGGLRLVDSWFVATGGVGAFDYSGSARTYGPISFRSRVEAVGASLHKLHPSAAALDANSSVDHWQLVVAVLATSDVSSASAARITYTSNGNTWHLTGRKYLGLLRDDRVSCDGLAHAKND